jgi:hypothetical protein
MELRARIRPLSRRAAFAAACVALLVSALAAAIAPPAHAAKKKKRAPVITRVAPLDVAVGETLTIRGRHFRKGRSKNTVVFKRRGARAVFTKAEYGTRKMLKVTVPETVQKFFLLKAGNPVPTKFRIRVLARKFGKRFTSLKHSPLVSGPRPPAPVVPDDEGDCDSDGVVNKVDADDDNDLLADVTESAIGTDPCKLDTDGDAVEDGYEFRSARDLNDDDYQSPNSYLPYPTKRPYPNALFADADVDYDGDGLTLLDEQALWKYTVARWAPRSLDALTYSDGEKYTRSITAVSYQQAPADAGEAQASLHKQWLFLRTAAAQGYPGDSILNMNGRTVTNDGEYAGTDLATDTVVSPLERFYFDEDHDNRMRDDELDEDGDGLGNYDEAHGYMQPSWWVTWYKKEKPYVIPYAGTRLDDADSDGDTIVDGVDDQDHDNVPNLQELSRRLVAGEKATLPKWAVGQAQSGIKWNRSIENALDPPPGIPHPRRAMVNPFNPCLPETDPTKSPACPVRVPANAWAPFSMKPEEIFNVFN